MKDKKKLKTFKLSDTAIRRLVLIAKQEGKNQTQALEFMIQEKADFYGIKVLRKKEIGSGAFPYGGGSKTPLIPQDAEVELPPDFVRLKRKKIAPEKSAICI